MIKREIFRNVKRFCGWTKKYTAYIENVNGYSLEQNAFIAPRYNWGIFPGISSKFCYKY